MQKSVLASLLLSVAIVLTTLLAFQNCSDPIDTYGDANGSGTGSSNTSVPGGAGNSSDLTNTGTSAVNPNAMAAPGSLATGQYFTTLYQGMLNRAPSNQEASDLGQYVGLGYGCAKLAQLVMGSPEYANDVAKLQPKQIITSLFSALLNRAPSLSESNALLSLTANYQTSLAGAGALAGYIMQQGEFKLYCSQFKNLAP
jgi:hypothetical protein